MKKLLGAAFAAILASGIAALAANLSLLSGPQDPSQLQATVNALIQSINSGITPQSMAPFNNARNILDNGAMAIDQRGTGTFTCGTTTVPQTTAYAADRWGCNVNVTSGAGQLTVITATPAPPAGFTNSLKLVRNSGALTQPQCVWQEIPTVDATTLAGQQVTYSAYVQALAGLAADQGSTSQAVNFVIVTGTGSDQGLQSFTASPAITPAFTGVATTQNASIALPVTPAWARYSAPSVLIPTTTTEIAVGVCFTPTATGAGTTDGFAFTGVQFEVGTAASPFEFRPIGVELEKVQRYYWQITEPAASVSIGPSGQGASTTTCILTIPLPVPMRVAPTAAFLGTALANSTWTVTHVVTNSALSTPFLAATAGGSTVNMLNLTATTGAVLTAGQTCTLTGAAGGAILAATADF